MTVSTCSTAKMCNTPRPVRPLTANLILMVVDDKLLAIAVTSCHYLSISLCLVWHLLCGRTDNRSVSRRDEGNVRGGSGVIVLAVSHRLTMAHCTGRMHRSDRCTSEERQKRRHLLAQLITIAAAKHRQPNDYRWGDFISGYRFEQMVSRCPDIG